jgi:Mn2+/Fe2+ NRAMP family transporter
MQSESGEGGGGWVERLKSVGPGAMVAGAFIRPGTVTTATVAGVDTGVTLLWALLFSVLATIVLQEMAARLGLVTGQGLGEAVRSRFRGTAGWLVAAGLVISAVALGNAAYQTGNLLGGSLGLSGLFGGPERWWAVAIGSAAFVLLWTGRYRVVERALVVLVSVMAVVFVATAATLLPSASELLSGLLVPSLPSGRDGRLLVIGLVGTTVVPDSLFLHASAVRERWEGPASLPAARTDTVLSVVVGGLVSMAVVVSAAAAGSVGEVSSAADMAVQLEPLLGPWAGAFFAVGLFAAGMSSAVTAPLAAAYATAGVLGWERDLQGARFRAVWILVLGAGLGFALAGVRPVPAILFAQVANGILLPAVALFLVLTVNDRDRMGEWTNAPWLNVAGGGVILVAAVLGARALPEVL